MSGIIGLISVSAATPGAGEVQSIELRSSSDSRTRATGITPASGKRIRIIACQVHNNGSTESQGQVYFGEGADILTTPLNAILMAVLQTDINPDYGTSWPDGAGPVGDVDEVVSFKSDVDLASDLYALIQWREE